MYIYNCLINFAPPSLPGRHGRSRGRRLPRLRLRGLVAPARVGEGDVALAHDVDVVGQRGLGEGAQLPVLDAAEDAAEAGVGRLGLGAGP